MRRSHFESGLLREGRCSPAVRSSKSGGGAPGHPSLPTVYNGALPPAVGSSHATAGDRKFRGRSTETPITPIVQRRRQRKVEEGRGGVSGQVEGGRGETTSKKVARSI